MGTTRGDSIANRKELTRDIQEITADRISEEMKALEECAEGGPMIALKERIVAVRQPRSEIVD